ncbi:amidohydrolase [Cupriavidus necator]|uniref:Amidohydrolase n=1 Tax=Cupriavidus necator TaxID=106590 RepID=A0A1U9UMV6_CUPNE|nr:M20 family metallopeptidase [Cupriavidus necator]AQV94012.1 amidohydrolase [Cupriavidus necator]
MSTTAPELNYIDCHSPHFTAMSDQIWNLAELRYEEFASAKLHIETLEAAGFRVTRGVADIPTAFVAEAGNGGPVIGILGEYDALSGLSQEAGALTCKPSSEISNGNGHGCGHHLLGTAAHLAAAAVKEHLERSGQPGTVRFYGCPAEEGGSGKTFMARAGLFDDLDAALTWHPSVYTGVISGTSLANIQAYFRFRGKAAHAANSPHLGRSALDAAELMNVGVNFLREHMLPDARVHYAMTDTGGLSPNVVQPNAEVLYLVRAPRNDQATELFERVKNVARGAALMTDCQLEVVFDKACSSILQNSVLNQLMDKHLQALGAPDFDADEIALASAFQQQTLTDEDIESASRSLAQAWRDPKPLFDHIDLYQPGKEGQLYGSTDVGDVSWVTPTAQCYTACYAFGTPFHSWQLVAQGKSSLAHKGMLLAARTLAGSAIELFSAPETLAQAKAELLERRGGKPYVCPIPDDVALPFRR